MRPAVWFLLLAVCVTGYAQDPIDYSLGAGSWPKVYQPRDVPQANLADSASIDRFIREGKLYLSLEDVILLALENNLDIEIGRYGRMEADTDLLRAKAGAQLSGVQTQISTLSTGQSAQGSGQQVQGQRGQADGITTNASARASGASSTGNAASFFGTQVTSLDPVFTSSMSFARQSNPQISDFVTGTNTLIQDTNSYNFGVSQGFTTGTTVNVGFSTVDSATNNLRSLFNPSLGSDASVSVSQRLLQGFGRSVNNRNIRIAKNNQEVQDLQFELQIVTTVNQIQQLYWDLVTFIAQAEGSRADLDLSERLVESTTRRVELGFQPRFEVVRVNAETTTYRQQLLDADRRIRQQQNVLKNAISKLGPVSSSLLGVELVPTDEIVVPDRDAVEPIQDLIDRALGSRPSLASQRMSKENSNINIKGIRNGMLPSIDVTAFARNNALAGSVNPDVANVPGIGAPNPFFTGGFGTALGQIFRRNFPDYGLFLNLNIPLKNRQAQADMTREQLRLRQQDIQLRQQENSVKLEVVQATEGLRNARDTYGIAKEARELREDMVEAEQKRFELGMSSIFEIVQVQRDLAAARTGEINAMSSYMAARNELDRATGQVLKRHNISIEAAYKGAAR